MNPYEVPTAKADKVCRADTSNRINWLAIIVAGVIYLIISIIIVRLLLYVCRLPDGTYSIAMEFNATNCLIVCVVPWVAGAIYLASASANRWAMNGLIYSLIPPVVIYSKAFLLSGDPLYPFPAILVWQLGATFVILSTMACVRRVLL